MNDLDTREPDSGTLEPVATEGESSDVAAAGSAPRSWRDRLQRIPVLAPSGRLRLVAVAGVVLVVLGSLGSIVLDRVTRLPDDAVLRVGDTTINQTEFAHRVGVLKALYGISAPTDPAGLDRFNRDSAQAIAVSTVVDQQAAQRNLTAQDKEAQDALAKMIQSQFPGGRDQYTAALGQLGVTEQSVLDEIKRQLSSTHLFDQITASVKPVTDADVQAAYNQRKAQMVAPEQRHLRNVVVDSQQKAQQVVDQVRAGGDLGAIAAQVSMDRSTAASGGDLGTLTKDQLEPAVGQAAFAAAPGAVYGPVQSRFGWNVGQVLQVTPARALSFDEVKENLRSQLDDERRQAIWRPWLTQQLEDAHVKYADAYRPANPDVIPATTPQ